MIYLKVMFYTIQQFLFFLFLLMHLILMLRKFPLHLVLRLCILLKIPITMYV